MALIDDIKAKYPSPQAARDDTIPATSISSGYCVGGALCLSVNVDNRFPRTVTLEYALRLLNPRLSTLPSERYATLIIENNDNGKFEEAWQVAQQALEYQ